MDAARHCRKNVKYGIMYEFSLIHEAITAFMEGNDFEDVIRTVVSLGGDCDTLTCIAGSTAEAFYGVPEEMKAECRKRLPKATGWKNHRPYTNGYMASHFHQSTTY